jgi:hypothetical protein
MRAHLALHVEPAPCDDCRFAQRCAEERLACEVLRDVHGRIRHEAVAALRPWAGLISGARRVTGASKIFCVTTRPAPRALFSEWFEKAPQSLRGDPSLGFVRTSLAVFRKCFAAVCRFQ